MSVATAAGAAETWTARLQQQQHSIAIFVAGKLSSWAIDLRSMRYAQ